MKITVTKGWITEWERDTFTLVFDTQSEEERKALLECICDRKKLKVTIEEADE